MPVVLQGETGRMTGSRSAGRLRREGLVPGVVYGLGMEPVSITVAWPEFRRALIEAGGSGAVRVAVGGKEHLTLIRELQRHPVRRDVIHVDFLAVDPDEVVDVEVPLVLGGVEEGDELKGVEVLMRSLDVSAKPAAIPSEIIIDVTVLRGRGMMTVADLALPPGVVARNDPADVIATSGAVGTDDDAVEAAAESDDSEAEAEGDGEDA